MSHSFFFARLLVPLLVPCVGCGSARDAVEPALAPDPLVWKVRRTGAPPVIDGRIDDAWRSAKALTVVVREAMGGGAPQRVVLRALCTKDRLYVLAQWPDATKSDMRDPWVWDAAAKAYARPTKPDDQFALEFPLSGTFQLNMMTATPYVADVWHWKAGRGNPAGWIDDKRHVIGDPNHPGSVAYEMGGKGTVYIARPMDTGRRAYRVVERPASHAGDRIDSYEPQQPDGSLADVRGKGLHDGSGWTLEMSRRFDTGHADDAVLDPSRDNVCAIAILNDELYWRHSVSGRILLRFPQE